MNKIKKKKELLNLSYLISNNKVIYLIDISYLNSNQLTFLRKSFHDFGVQMKIVKNTLLKKAIENNNNRNLNPFFSVLNGNTTILYSNKNVDNIIPNIIKKFHLKENIQKPYLKSAYVQKSFYFGNENLDILINIKSKEDLIIDILDILQFSIRNLILSLCQSSIDKIYWILKILSYNESEKKIENKKNKNNMIEKLAEQLVNLTVKEVNELTLILKEKYGIKQKNIEKLDSHSNKLNDSSKEKTKSVFNITLTSVGSSKLSIVKLIKEITGKGLKESKDLADNVPSIIKESVDQKEANHMKNRFEELGAKVELK